MELEQTKGYQIAIAFKPFIDPKCKEHTEIIKDMARDINRINDELKLRVKQLLTALEYHKLTDFQRQVIKALEREL